MRIGVPREIAPGEHRVALVPEVISKLTAKGLDVLVQSGAGAGALLSDDAFAHAGAAVSADVGEIWRCDIVVTISPPDPETIRGLGSGSILIGFLAPLTSPQTTRALADAKATAFAMEAIPRISRAQSMDALSSQSNVAGYRAALLGAEEMGRFYPMLMTAAGTIPPAKVLVLGVGVAGLQALATAKRLGARTTGYDVRPEVRAGDDDRGRDDAPAPAHLHVGGVQPDVGPVAFDGATEEGFDLLVDLLAQAADLAPGDACWSQYAYRYRLAPAGRTLYSLFVCNKSPSPVTAEKKDAYSWTFTVFGEREGFPIRLDCVTQQLVKRS